ncbi:MAG: B12-binding domain-containing radical SAM protein [Lachnospiraceae bacterium]|nr:B12-binding domain-containing radical SAM protein [Lachnospiraceae bacterium]
MKVFMGYVTSSLSNEEHLGTASIAAYLEKNSIDVLLREIIYNPEAIDTDKMLEELPEDAKIFGFPLFSTNAQVIYQLAYAIKKKYENSMIFVGGRLATDAYDYVFHDCKSIDFVVLGDGEIPVLQVVHTLENNGDISELPNIVTRDEKSPETKVPYIVDIKELPWVSRQYLEQMLELGTGTARLTTTRGCCGNCSFCSFNSYTKVQKTARWQGRDIEDVFEEVVYIYKKYGVRSFSINDGSFEDPGSLGKQRIKDFCNLVLSYPVTFHFWCFLRAETFSEDDIELIKLMKKAGFSEVFIGVEAGNESDLAVYRKRASLEDNRRAIRLFEECGINVLFGFIMFNPFSTLSTLRENYEFLVEHNNWRPHAFAGKVAIFYKTELHAMCEKEGLLTDDFSYINTMAYNFKDSEADRLWRFVEENLLQSIVFTKYDLDLFYFNNFINDMAALFPKEMEKFIPKYKQIMREFAYIQARYFKIIYVDLNFEKALSEFKQFSNEMSKAIRKMNSFKISIIIKEPFRSFIQETVGESHKKVRR